MLEILTGTTDFTFQFDVLISYRFQRHIQDIKEFQKRKEIYECIQDIITKWENWKNRIVKKPRKIPSNRKVKTARINDGDRLIFEGPVKSHTSNKTVLFIHDFCSHNQLIHILKEIVKRELDENDFEVVVSCSDESQDINSIGKEFTAFAKPISPIFFAEPKRIDDILQCTKTNISLTKKQIEVLKSPRPLLINGQAGSGKTTILIHYLAASIIKQRELKMPPKRIIYLSYNRKLIEQAQKDLEEILEFHFQDKNIDNVKFVAFKDFLKEYVNNPRKFNDKTYVSFGKFKKFYIPYMRNQQINKKISPEVAWHNIRSIMKGACKPIYNEEKKEIRFDERPPLSIDQYKNLAKSRQEINEDLFKQTHDIGCWYQEKIMQDKLWDDQDLAWEALSWIIKEKKKNPDIPLYSEIYCDEVQDLTENEFAILLSLLKPLAHGSQEDSAISLAGDPLQTINPTGFRWDIISQYVYKIENRPVKRHELEENWRSDKRIVDFANCIQCFRAFYLDKEIKPQEAFEKDGDFPNIINLKTPDEIKIIKERLGDILSESAIIIWPEEDEEILDHLQKDEILRQLVLDKFENQPMEDKKICEEKNYFLDFIKNSDKPIPKINNINVILDTIMAKLDLYQVSDAKGLEFKRVFLYKFGDNPEFKKWADFMMSPATSWNQLDIQKKIPLLYFLNRLYISITRAQLYLFIIDNPEMIDNFWKKLVKMPEEIKEIWKSLFLPEEAEEFWEYSSKSIIIIPRPELKQRLNDHPAFQSKPDYEKDGDRHFEYAEIQENMREYQRARNSYEKARAIQKIKKVDARIDELSENWELAGDIYNEFGVASAEFPKAADCYEKSRKWEKAINVLKELSGTKYKRRLEICKFNYSLENKEITLDYALKFSEYVETDSEINKDVLWQLIQVLSKHERYEVAIDICKRCYNMDPKNLDIQAGIQAGKYFTILEKYDDAIEFFKKCSFYGNEYLLCLRKKAEILKSQNKFPEAAKLYADASNKSGDKDDYLQKGLCILTYADTEEQYNDVLDCFTRANYVEKEYHICKAEIAERKHKHSEAIEHFYKLNKFDRVIRIIGVLSEEDRKVNLKYIAESYFKNGQYKEAYGSYNELQQNAREKRDYPSLNNYLEKMGDCQIMLGNKENAYDIYREGRIYDKAIGLANELGKSEIEIKKIKAEEALNRMAPDFDSAVKYYEEIGDLKQVNLLKGRKLKFNRNYLDAYNHFISIGEWEESLDCIDTKYFNSDEFNQLKTDFMKKFALVPKRLNYQEKRERVMDWVRDIREDEEWSNKINPVELGMIYENCASFSEVNDFYEKYIEADEIWAKKGWIRIKENQIQYLKEKGDSEGAGKVQERVEKQKKKWKFTKD